LKTNVTASVRHSSFVIRHSSPVTRRAFTLVEVMVVMTLLTLIVIALMGVFSATQSAFRASVTQTDVLESGRAAMGLITSDLRTMSPSYGITNGARNFYAKTNQFQLASQSAPLVQPLVGTVQGRTNVLEEFFILSRENQTWIGTGYVVDTTSQNFVNPLYRFSMKMSVSDFNSPAQLYTNFSSIAVTNQLYWSRLMEGVVTLRVRAYDLNGVWLTNGYVFNQTNTVENVHFLPSALGEVGFHMFNNALPAAVEIELATLEDRALQRAESRPYGPVRDQYLSDQAGRVHIFRQRVAIPNVVPAAYQ